MASPFITSENARELQRLGVEARLARQKLQQERLKLAEESLDFPSRTLSRVRAQIKLCRMIWVRRETRKGLTVSPPPLAALTRSNASLLAAQCQAASNQAQSNPGPRHKSNQHQSRRHKRLCLIYLPQSRQNRQTPKPLQFNTV